MPRRNKNYSGTGHASKKVSTSPNIYRKKRVPNDLSSMFTTNNVTTELRPNKIDNYKLTIKNPSEHGYTS